MSGTPKSEKDLRTLKQKADRLLQRGSVALASAQLANAKVFFEQALDAYSSDPDSPGAARSLLNLGRAVELLGDYDRARDLYQQSVDLHSRLKDDSGVARSEAFLGNIAWAQGVYAKASDLMGKALQHYNGVGDRSGQAWVTDMMANLQLAQGRPTEAEKLHRAAYALALEIGDNPVGRAWNDFHLAAVELERGDREQAQAGFERALEIFHGLGDILGEVACCTHLGEIACARRDFAAAERYILHSLRLALPTGCKPLLIDAMTSLTRLLMGRGENDKALGILMFVLSHPNCRRQTKDRMVALAKALEANFSQKEIAGGFDWAKHFTLEEMASAWVKNLSPEPVPKAKVRKKPKS